ncbi:galactose oxidase [Thozetella sp. PMI_491]|nr:galactose oxidase [Thozetella sp. PMI_491]
MTRLLRTIVPALAWVGACLAETWSTLANIPTGTLREFSAVAIPGKIATVGGVLNAGATTDMIQLYDIATNSWSKASITLPIPINHGNVVSMNGKIYLLMGLTTSAGSLGWKSSLTTGVYDPQKDSWQVLPEPPAAQARGAAAVGGYNGILYVAGGKAGTGAKSVDTVTAFNATSGKWIPDYLPSAAAKLPAPRDHVGGAVVGHKFYVIGGRDTDITNVKDTLFILDLEDMSKGWATGPALPTARGGLCAAALGTKIYTFGGEGNQAANSGGVYSQTEVYDTEAGTWTKLRPMKTPRHGTAAAASDGKIYIPGGGTTSGTGSDTNIFEVFTP